jgi:methyl-accepting chemotaxis protein
MSMPKDAQYGNIQESIVKSWREYVGQMESALNTLDEQIEEASQMSSTCTSEWCEATEHVIDEISNSLFSISEPRGTSEEDSRRIKDMKKKVYDLYAKYKSAAGK